MICRLLLAALFLIFSIFNADAASRFWNPLIVSAVVNNGSGLCRLTISPAITGSGLVTGNSVITTGITGATGCNVTTTITVISSTQIDLDGTTFGGAYVNGGCAAGGNWTATNTSNWAATSTATCGSGGQTVPGSSDTVTLDANSLGGTITLNFGGTITIQSLTMGAFAGTFDNSVNNNNITVTNTGTAFSGSGSATRTYKFGTSTITLSGTSATWTMTSTTGLTYSGNTNTNIVFSGSGTRSFNNGGSLSHGNLSYAAQGGGGRLVTTGSTTINSLSITPPNYLAVESGSSLTITNAFNIVGTSTAQIGISGSIIGSSPTIIVGAGATAQWVAIRDVAFNGSPVATNSFDLGNNSGVTITAPSGGSGGTIIGGGL